METKNWIFTIGGTAIGVSLTLLAGQCDLKKVDKIPEPQDAGQIVADSGVVVDAGIPDGLPPPPPPPKPEPPAIEIKAPFKFSLPYPPRISRSAIIVQDEETFDKQIGSERKLLITGDVNCDPCFIDNVHDLIIEAEETEAVGTILLGANVQRIHFNGGDYGAIRLLHPPTPEQRVQDIRISGINATGDEGSCFEIRGERIMIENSKCSGINRYCIYADAMFVNRTSDIVVTGNHFITSGEESCTRFTDVHNLVMVDNLLESQLKHVWRVHGRSSNIFVDRMTSRGRGFMVGTMEGDEVGEITHIDSSYYMQELGRAGDNSCFDYNTARVSNLTVRNVDCYTNKFCAVESQAAITRPDWSITDSECYPESTLPESP